MRTLFILSFVFILSAPAIAADKVLDIQQVRSPTGIEAWLVEDHSLPLISLKFSFKEAGAINDGVKKQGIARLLSNTMDEGAGELKSQEFQKALSDHSITLYFNSGRDNFGGQLKTLTRHKEKAFELLKLALTQPRFDEEPVERMRQANLSRIKSSMTDPDWMAARIFNDRAFDGQPYALNSGGTLSTLPKITSDDLRQHVRNHLTQDKLIIGVAGDITKEELSTMIADVFSDLPKTSKGKALKQFTLQNSGSSYLYTKDIPQTVISVGLPSLKMTDPDYFALNVMNHIFGASGFGSNLMEQAREKEGLTYGIYSSLLHQDYVDGLTISTSTKNESAPRILEIIQQEMQNMIDKKVPKDTLKKTKSYMTGSLPLSLTSMDKVSSILLSLQLNNRPVDYLNQYSNKINAVSAKDIQRVSERLFKDTKPIIVMVGNPASLKNITPIESLSNVE